MFKRNKKFFQKSDKLKSQRRMIIWFLCLLTLSILQEYFDIFVFAQTCSNLKFPITLGFTSGETIILQIDQDSFDGYIYVAGTSTATELKVPGAVKSVFIAQYKGVECVWIKSINDPSVDTVESMSAMGSSSIDLILYATKSSDPFIPLIFTISKSDGKIVRTVEIRDTNIGNVNPTS